MNHDIIVKSSERFTFVEKAYIPNTSCFLVITEALIPIIEEYFSSQVPSFTLVNSLRFDFPCTTPTYDKIHLCCMDTSWSQIAFQLTHEFCHLMIGRSVTQNLRWFEEVIAEISSLFFMTKLSSIWKSTGILGYPDYGYSIEEYVHNRKHSVTSDIALSDILRCSELWQYLISSPENRELNLKIAIKLLPVFEINSSLWEIVPFLGSLSENQDFPYSFMEWRKLSNKRFHPALDALWECFTTDNTN